MWVLGIARQDADKVKADADGAKSAAILEAKMVLRIFFKILVMRANFGDFGDFETTVAEFWFFVKIWNP